MGWFSSSREEDVPDWNPFVHAYETVFGERFSSLDELTDFNERHMAEIVAGANRREPESLLRATLGSCLYKKESFRAPEIGQVALEVAKEAGLDLGRYWYAYGFGLQTQAASDVAVDERYWFAYGFGFENFARAEETLQAFDRSLQLGFGEAAFHVGQIRLLANADLRNAIATWRTGRDQFGSSTCSDALKELETDPGSYSAVVRLADGTYDVIMIADRPGGFGISMDAFRQP
jgi:hypothetical protein